MSLYRDLAMPMFRLRFYDDDHDLDLMDAMRRAMMMQDSLLLGDSGSDKKANETTAQDSSPAVAANPLNSVVSMNRMNMKDFAPLMSTDLVETDKDYNIHVDLPGVSAEDMEVRECVSILQYPNTLMWIVTMDVLVFD